MRRGSRHPGLGRTPGRWKGRRRRRRGSGARGAMGGPPAAEPRVHARGCRQAAVRGRRIRHGGRDRDARARRGPGPGAGGDGARGRLAPAGVGAARATLASPQRGPRLLRARAGQHTRASPPLVATRSRAGWWSPMARWWPPAHRSRGRCCWCVCGERTASAPCGDRTAGVRGHSGGSGLAARTTAARRRRPSRATSPARRVLSIGIASTGIFTFLYLATASHVLDKASYSRISLCWAIMFVILSVIYRPIEQLLSRTIADRRARGLHGHPLRIPASIQLGFALALPGSRTRAATPDRGRHVRRLNGPLLDPGGRRAGLRGELFRAWLARGPSAVRPVRRARIPRIDVALSVRSGRCGRNRLGPGGRGAWDGRGAIRLAVRDAVRLLQDAAPAPGRSRGAAGGRRGARGTGSRTARGGRGRSDAAPWVGLRRLRGGDHARRADAAERRCADRRRQVGRHDQHGVDRVRVQRDADRPRPAAALSGDPDRDPAPPGGTRGQRERRGVPPRRADDDPARSPLSREPYRLGCWRSGRR